MELKWLSYGEHLVKVYSKGVIDRAISPATFYRRRSKLKMQLSLFDSFDIPHQVKLLCICCDDNNFGAVDEFLRVEGGEIFGV